MRDTIYLILERDGAVAIRKNVPNLNSGQVAVRLKLEISDKFFNRFVPQVNLSIPDSMVIQPEVRVEVEED